MINRSTFTKLDKSQNLADVPNKAQARTNLGVSSGGPGLGGSNSGCCNQIVAIGACGTVSGGYCNNGCGGASTIGGGVLNIACGACSTVSGGYCNKSSSAWSTIGGGRNNTASGAYSTVAGGAYNTAFGGSTFVGGGNHNYAKCVSVVGGGRYNCACGACSTVSGGYNNAALGSSSVISGGYFNTTSTYFSVVDGGACGCSNKYAQWSMGGNNPSVGSQVSILQWYGQTTNSTQTEIYLGGVASNEATIDSNMVWTGHIDYMGFETNGLLGVYGRKYFYVLNTAGVVTSGFSDIVAATGIGSNAYAVAFSTSSTALVIKVTGALANTVNWKCSAWFQQLPI